MGLLDDAIREHLELKRRHGADAEEVARLEQEALGPARRSSGDAVEVMDPPAAAPPDTNDKPPAPADGGQETVEYSVEDEPEEVPPVEDDDLEWEDTETHEAAAPGAQSDEESDEEDVLEETPEFLQETPEHDRLWFEQKPPKDFDF